MRLAAHRFGSGDLTQLRPWFEDAETTRWLGDSDYPRRLLELTAESGRWAFVVTEHGEPVALVDVEQDEQDAHSAALAIAVAPAKRGTGIGRRAINAIAERPELAAVKELVGEVEAGNIAAEKCVLAAGFSREGTASESGFTRYVLRLS